MRSANIIRSEDGKEELSFYGLRPLEFDDFQFDSDLPEGEEAACYSYELDRQVIARKLHLGKFSPHLEDTARLKWLDQLALPWCQLPREIKNRRIEETITEHPLPWAKIGTDGNVEDPDRILDRSPGELFAVKIDWDWTDKELCDAFRRTLKALRGTKTPLGDRAGTLASAITSIVAQRVIDCRGKPKRQHSSPTDSQAKEDLVEFSLRVAGGRLTSWDSIMKAGKRYMRTEGEIIPVIQHGVIGVRVNPIKSTGNGGSMS